jgi:phosphopantothenoylcysteine decarboxylase/phosphopantothenate--cysteine ligase
MPKKKSNLSGLNILLGVSGGVAAYKAVDLASRLTAGGAKVNTIMTENACRLIGPKSFEAVTNSAVYTTLWNTTQEYKISHINLADWADIVVVTPATANIIGKIANGICDDLLSTTLCACWAKPTLLAPAMNNNMWTNAAVQRNIKAVKGMGFKLIGPEKGRFACGTEGIGRMSEPQDILEAIEKIASEIKRNKK